MTLYTRAVVCASVYSICVGCEANDYIESRYDDFSEAQAAGAVTRGWIPSFLPSSSTGIREIHNVDTNEVWIAFTASRNALEGIEECDQSARAEGMLPRNVGVSWWPQALSEGAAETTVSQYSFYRCGAAAFIAVDRAEPKFFYWLISH